MNKNEIGKWIVFAYGAPDHASVGLPITGDAANITANIRIDGAAANAVDDTNPAELEDGYYIFDITAVESNGDNLLLAPQSSTADVIVIAVPGAVWTRPANFNDNVIQTGDNYAIVNGDHGLVSIQNDVDLILVDTTEIGIAGAGLSNIDLPNQSMDIVGNITGNLSGAVGSVTAEVTADVVKISGDATAADNLELMYDGTGYTDETAPSSRSQVSSLTSGSAAISTITETALVISSDGTETNTFANTQSLDGVVNSLDNGTGTTDAYYEFQVGANGRPVSITWNGYANNNGSTYAIYAYNYDASDYDQIGSVSGAQGSTIKEQTFSLTTAHVGVGADVGKVRFRFSSTDGILFATDRILCSYAIVYQSVGYALGSIWVDDSASNIGTVNYVDGTADNPVSTWAAALTLSSQLGIKSFQIANGTSITLTGVITEFNLHGQGWILALGSQAIGGAYVTGAFITGTGIEGVTIPKFDQCAFGAASIPPSTMKDCGYGKNSGTFTGNADGEYVINNGRSLVPGSGTPNFIFTGLGAATGINSLGWIGGSNYTLDQNCILSHNVLAGGGTTITSGGATQVEVRGTTRSLTLHLSAVEVVQFVGITGPIILDGTTTAEVNLYGVASSVSDTTSAATLNDETINATNIDTIIADTDDIQTRLPASLTADGNMKSDLLALNGNIQAAINLAASALGIIPTSVAGTPTTTSFTLTTGSVEDVYPKRVMLITSGTYAGLPLVVTAYDGASKLVTFATSLFVLTVGDTLVLV